MRTDIPFFYNAQHLSDGLKTTVGYSLKHYPHTLVVGATNSGKTTTLSLMMGKICKYIPDSQITLLDFKNYDFAEFEGAKRHYGYTNCLEGLNTFYDMFSARLSGEDKTTNHRILVFDEVNSFLLSFDKKIADDLKAKLSKILFLGRSYSTNVCLSMQRADSDFFKNGAREQLGAMILMGNISKEQKLMLVNDNRNDMVKVTEKGQGHLFLDGKDIQHIQVPTVTDRKKLNSYIRLALTR